MKNEKIYKIRYVDAYYLYKEECSRDFFLYIGDRPETKLSPHEAYGYIRYYKDSIILDFIKKTDEKDLKMVKGLILPNNSLLSKSKILNKSFPNISLKKKVHLQWDDLCFAENISIRESSIMETVGILVAIESDHIVIGDPDTKRIYPLPEKSHPNKKPSYYIIPISFIKNIKQI